MTFWILTHYSVDYSITLPRKYSQVSFFIPISFQFECSIFILIFLFISAGAVSINVSNRNWNIIGTVKSISVMRLKWQAADPRIAENYKVIKRSHEIPIGVIIISTYLMITLLHCATQTFALIPRNLFCSWIVTLSLSTCFFSASILKFSLVYIVFDFIHSLLRTICTRSSCNICFSLHSLPILYLHNKWGPGSFTHVEYREWKVHRKTYIENLWELFWAGSNFWLRNWKLSALSVNIKEIRNE